MTKTDRRTISFETSAPNDTDLAATHRQGVSATRRHPRARERSWWKSLKRALRRTIGADGPR